MKRLGQRRIHQSNPWSSSESPFCRSSQNDFRELTENKDYPIQATFFDAVNPERNDAWLADYQAAFPQDKFDQSIIGPVVGVHCGKNTVAIIWCRDLDSYFDENGQPLPDVNSAEVGEKF